MRPKLLPIGWSAELNSAPLLVNDDVPPIERCRGIRSIDRAHHVVIDDGRSWLVDDPDAEFIGAGTAGYLAAGGGENESVIASAVDLPRALILSLGTGDDRPIVVAAVQLKVGDLELELGFPGRDGRAFCILRSEPEVCLTR